MSILWVYTVRTHNTFISFLFFHFSLLILSSSSSPPFSIFSYFNLRKPAWWYQSTKNTNKSQPYADISDDIVLMLDDVPFPVFESSFTQQQKPYGFNKNDIIYFANLQRDCLIERYPLLRIVLIKIFGIFEDMLCYRDNLGI